MTKDTPRELFIILASVAILLLALYGVGVVVFEVINSRLDTMWKFVWFFVFLSMPFLAIIGWLFIRKDYITIPSHERTSS